MASEIAAQGRERKTEAYVATDIANELVDCVPTNADFQPIDDICLDPWKADGLTVTFRGDLPLPPVRYDSTSASTRS